MLGDELSRESQLLLHAARMSFALPPDVYAIFQGEQGGYRQYCYFVTTSAGKNILVGSPIHDEDLAEALDALGGIDTLLAIGGDESAEAWSYEFGCDVISAPSADAEERLADDLLLLKAANHLLLIYEQHSGILFCGDMFTIESDEMLSGDKQAAVALIKRHPITAILPRQVRGEFITEGGADALAAIR